MSFIILNLENTLKNQSENKHHNKETRANNIKHVKESSRKQY